MKSSNILKFIILILISNGLYAQDFYSYKLFDNKFQAIYPGEPSIQNIPKEVLNPETIKKSIPYEYRKELTQKKIDEIVSYTIMKLRSSQPYIYVDKINQISYSSQSMPSQLEHKNYIWHGIKNTLDDLIKKGLKADNRKIIDFSSSLYKKTNTYIAIYTSTYIMEGQKVYSSTKHIYYKDKIYKWTLGYVNKNNKSIFDNYRKYCKAIK